MSASDAPGAPTLAQRLAERDRPAARVFGYQRWEHLLFLHWAWSPEAIQQRLPPGLTVDTFDGRAWLGVVPFFMNRIRPAYLPAVPWLSSFLELNLRTYVFDARGRSGVWFFSLDCNRAPAVWIARWRFHLPYQHATMSARVDGDAVAYASRRRGDDHTGRFAYAPVGPPEPAAPGTLEFFLAERYRLFAQRRDGVISSGQVHHVPYPLSAARVDAFDARVIALAGFDAPDRPPDHALHARRVDVAVFPLTTA
jgi:hypothetical protein